MARYKASFRPKLRRERGMTSSDHTIVTCLVALSGCHAQASDSSVVESRFDALTTGTMNSWAQGAGPQQRCVRRRLSASGREGVGCARLLVRWPQPQHEQRQLGPGSQAHGLQQQQQRQRQRAAQPRERSQVETSHAELKSRARD